MPIPIDRLKRQCRIDFDDDDTLLRELAAEAEAEAVRATGRTRDELKEMGGGDYPEDFTGAIVMRAAERYAHPEGSEKPNAAYLSIIRSYQRI